MKDNEGHPIITVGDAIHAISGWFGRHIKALGIMYAVVAVVASGAWTYVGRPNLHSYAAELIDNQVGDRLKRLETTQSGISRNQDTTIMRLGNVEEGQQELKAQIDNLSDELKKQEAARQKDFDALFRILGQ